MMRGVPTGSVSTLPALVHEGLGERPSYSATHWYVGLNNSCPLILLTLGRLVQQQRHCPDAGVAS
jgi:hypothetical protein